MRTFLRGSLRKVIFHVLAMIHLIVPAVFVTMKQKFHENKLRSQLFFCFQEFNYQMRKANESTFLVPTYDVSRGDSLRAEVHKSITIDFGL